MAEMGATVEACSWWDLRPWLCWRPLSINVSITQRAERMAEVKTSTGKVALTLILLFPVVVLYHAIEER